MNKETSTCIHKLKLDVSVYVTHGILQAFQQVLVLTQFGHLCPPEGDDHKIIVVGVRAETAKRLLPCQLKPSAGIPGRDKPGVCISKE